MTGFRKKRSWKSVYRRIANWMKMPHVAKSSHPIGQDALRGARGRCEERDCIAAMQDLKAECFHGGCQHSQLLAMFIGCSYVSVLRKKSDISCIRQRQSSFLVWLPWRICHLQTSYMRQSYSKSYESFILDKHCPGNECVLQCMSS